MCGCTIHAGHIYFRVYGMNILTAQSSYATASPTICVLSLHSATVHVVIYGKIVEARFYTKRLEKKKNIEIPIITKYGTTKRHAFVTVRHRECV